MKYPTHSLHQAVREKVQERLIVIFQVKYPLQSLRG